MNYPPRVSLAHLPTPIVKLARLSKSIGKEIYVWRDDLTGFAESGNKLRKLEFLLAQALNQGAGRVITCGGMQSNHARATGVACRRLGLNVTLVLREPKQGRKESDPLLGNLLLDHIFGADVCHVPYAEYIAAGGGYGPFLQRTSRMYQSQGENVYAFAEGGSVPLGCLGYMLAVEEMQSTWRALNTGSSAPDSLFFAVGSGGTHAGLHLGFLEYGLDPASLWAVNICDSADYFQKRVGQLVQETATAFNLKPPTAPLQILDGYVGAGYAMTSDEDLHFYAQLARSDGVLLDPVYTGKAFRGMLSEIAKTPERFGQKILFLHSGGTFATFAFQEQYEKVMPKFNGVASALSRRDIRE